MAAAQREGDLVRANAEIEELKNATAARSDAVRKLEVEISSKESAVETALKKLESERLEREKLEARIRELEAESETGKKTERDRREHRRFIVGPVIMGLLAAGVLGSASGVMLAEVAHTRSWGRWTFWSLAVLVWTGLFLLWERAVVACGEKVDGVRKWIFFEKARSFRAWFYGAVSVVLLGALGKIVADMVLRWSK